MEAAKEVDAAEEPSRTDVQLGKKEEPGRIRVLSVDKLTVEKIVLESSSGSREVLLTKNESSRKLSIKSEPGRTLPTRANEERNESTDVKYRASLPEDAFASHSSVNVSGNARSSEKISKATDTNHHQTARSVERRIKPIKLTKSPSIGGIVVTGLKSTYPGNARNKIPPKVPEKPTARNLALFARNEKEISVVDSKHDERSILARNRILDEVSSRNVTTNVNVESVEVAERKEIDEKPAVETRERIAEKQRENIEENGDDTTLEEITAKDRLEKSQSKIEVLQQNLSTKIDANTAEKYKRRLLELRASCALKLPVVVDANANVKLVGDFAFDKEFLRRHNLDQRLKIEENRVLETDLDRVSNGERGDEESNERIVTERSAKPSYSKKVSEVEKRWSGEFLENRLERRSSESSKSSYVEEFGSVSSRESVGEEHVTDAALFLEQGNRRTESEEGGGRSSIDVDGRQTSEEVLADSTDVSTVDSDSCLEDRIKAVDEDIDETTDETVDGADRRQVEFERANRWIESIVPSKDQFHDRRNEGITDRDKRQLGKPSSFYRDAGLGSTDSIDSSFATRSPSEGDGYATLIREFTMETSAMAAGSSRAKKEEKQKKKLGLRRLLPGFFSPKDSRKDYKKKESKERKRQDDRHFARYQQNGNYTRSPDTMNLNEDIKRNVKLDNSLNGSIIEERLDEIKRELFPDQGPITSTPDHLARDDDQNLLRDHRAGPPRSYTTDSSLSSIAPDERWNERNNAHLGISPDIRKFEQRQKREEFGQRYGQLERKHSLQEPNHATRSYFFHRNHGPSGRISAPPSERYLVRPRAIHPIDRPLPAIPHSRTELANYENYLEELEEIPSQTPRYGKNAYAYGLTADKSTYSNEPGLYENDNASGLILKSVSAQVKITRQPIVNQNHRAPLVGRSPKYPSSGSSQKSGDYADSSCTPNSSQKSEFSPSSSKSGEYYLHSPRDSGSPTGRDLDDDCRREGIYENEKSPSRSSTRCMDERIYDESPSSACEDRATPTNVAKQLDRSMEDSMEKRDATPNRSPAKSLQIAEKLDDPQRHEQPTNQSVGRSPASSPSGSQGKTVPSPGTRALPPLRRSQPNEQILIASPKRESPYETRIPRPSNESRRYAVESPVHITNSPRRLQTVNSLDQRGQEPSANPREDRSFTGTRMANFSGQGSSANLTAELQRPEPIYGHRGQPVPNQRSTYRVNAQKKDCEDRVAWVQGRASSPAKSPQKRGDSARGDVERNGTRTEKSGRSVDPQPTESQRPRQGHGIQSQRPVPSHASELQRSRIPCQEKSQPVANTGHVDSPRPIQQQPQQQSLQPRSLEEPVYVQRVAEPVYGQRGTIGGALSPSKQQTRQHLEAFYWQQKALEARRKSVATPASANPRQTARKIDLPEVREAVYWQQLKKLDEEQQRRIYEQNLIGDTAVAPGGSKSSGRPSGSRQGTIRSPATTDLSVSIPIGDPASWVDDRRRPKANPTGKPPLMQSQKGQNQPVLIVRPQQAIRDRREVATKPLDPARLEAQRSKSASPHFHRGDAHQTVPRKIEGRSIYEEEASDVDGKTAPPPIFKRGSLIGGESVEYGSVGGAKRVSFSNQSTVGPDLASGSWPTKHGTAPEPPTRRHRSEDSTSDTDSVFYHQDRCDAPQCTDVAEYDADRPLPPLPKDSPTNATRPAVTRNNAYGDLGWNANPDPRRATSPIADQVQQMLRQKEEEWNPDGKGRQSNDTGGSGRGEGEAGSNEIPIGRRGGGGGGGGVGSGGGGSVGGGSVLGVGGGGGSGSIGGGSVGRSGSGGGRSRDEPRRHTLGGDHQPSLHHQQFNAGQQLHPLHPHHPHHLPPPHGQYGTPPSRHTTMDLEMGTKSRQRKSPLPRGFPPPSSTMLFDDDPGIMSEVETSSTGFRRGGKQRSSLPVVRTPSKTLERPLGLVFLQYRNETKRALLPNEITSIDTVKALFVRSFPKQLTMEYLDSPHVKVYIHDSNKNMFYELEDLRSHLRDIRDRSVLRLFESSDGVPGISSLPPHWEDQSYFSEPEFDSEYQHQHIHKSKTTKNSTSVSSGYYVGGSSTLPRGGQMMRAYSPAASSVVGGPTATPTQPKPLATPDKSVSFEKSVSFSDEPPDMNSPKQHSPQHAADTKPTKPAIKSSTLPRMSSQERDRHKPTPPPKPAALVAGQYVYRDLALTPEMYNQLRGLQKKAKDLRQEVRNLRRMSQAQAHTVRETIRDTFITIRAMLLSGGDAAWTGGDAEKIRLSREEDLYKQEMLRLEKDLTELESTVEELRGNVINRKTRVNMSDVENMALILSKSSKTVADLKLRFPSLQEGMKGLLSSEMEKVVREEKFLKEEPERLESALRRCKKLTGTLVTLKRLASVQEQRLPNAASVDAEETPPITPTSAQHSKAAAPVPAERTVVGSASVIGGGSHPHEPPTAHQQRPENALDALLDELQTFSRPSSQLGHVPGSTTILSEMGRSGSRETTGAVPAGTVTPGRAPCISDIGRKGSVDSSSGLLTGGTAASLTTGAQNAAGTLRRLHSYPSSSDTDTSPPIARLQVSLQEQPSLPVLPQGFVPGQKPPVPERNAELLQLASARRVPPPPPPRTSSRSPLASPTSPQLPPRNHACNLQSGNTTLRRPPARTNLPAKEGKPPMALPADANNPPVPVPVPVPVPEQSSTPVVTTVLHNSSSSQSSIVLSASNSSSCESVNSQEGVQSKKGRQEQLEQRHQELLRKQKALQEQYARLQQLQRNTAGLTTVPPAPPDLLKKTGSESNLLVKMGLGLSAASSGSLTSLTAKLATSHESSVDGHQPRQDELLGEQQIETTATGKMANSTASNASTIVQQTITPSNESNGGQGSLVPNATCPGGVSSVSTVTSVANATTTTTSKIYETDIL
ncbi:uncharacterized protein LOC143146994 isoform X14 [Ptiloglossa arizonensis]|uniref:uncharacterized protein LOC143146994 isoform X14 n=1 Tax=Ptiloglossa arizonensis TaxID=3350558 RepID=UPI003FA07CC4